MCLAPKMPPAPQAPPPPPDAPIPVTPENAKPVTVKPTMTKRESLRQASKGTSSLSIPLSTGGMDASTPNLSIGSIKA